MVDIYSAVITKDILKKRKKWVDGIITIDSFTRAVKVSESGEDCTNIGRQVFSGIVDTKTAAKLIDLEEVKLGSCLVTITQRTSGDIPVPSGVKKVHPQVSGISNNVSYKATVNTFLPPHSFQSHYPAPSVTNRDVTITSTTDSIVHEDVVVQSSVLYAPKRAAVGGLLSLNAFICPSSKYSSCGNNSNSSSSSNQSGDNRSSNSTISSSHDTMSKIKSTGATNTKTSSTPGKMTAFTINSSYNQLHRICQVDLSSKSSMSYAVQFSSAIVEELQMSLASSMSTLEGRVLRALGINLVKPIIDTILNNKPVKSNKDAILTIDNRSTTKGTQNNGTSHGMTSNSISLNRSSPRPSFHSITETIRGAGISFINCVEVIVSPPKDEEYNSNGYSSNKWGKSKTKDDNDNNYESISKKVKNGNERVSTDGGDEGLAERDTKLYFKVSEAKHKSSARGINLLDLFYHYRIISLLFDNVS